MDFLDKDYSHIDKLTGKERVMAEIRSYVIEPYIDKFTYKVPVDVKVAEFLKAQEMYCKLAGFDKTEGEELPDEIEINLP